MGERQHSLNPSDHNVQPHSQLGAISRAGGCECSRLSMLPGGDWGLLWAVLAVLGQLAIVQPAPARLLINQGLWWDSARATTGTTSISKLCHLQIGMRDL